MKLNLIITLFSSFLICYYSKFQKQKTGLYNNFSFYEWMEIIPKGIVSLQVIPDGMKANLQLFR